MLKSLFLVLSLTAAPASQASFLLNYWFSSGDKTQEVERPVKPPSTQPRVYDQEELKDLKRTHERTVNLITGSLIAFNGCVVIYVIRARRKNNKDDK